MSPVARVRVIVVGLVIVGGALGATAASLTIALLSAVLFRSTPGWIDLMFAGGIGALLGAVFGPATLWTMLRHVPIGRAMRDTFIGAIIGALGGSLLMMPHVGALIGFLVAAVRLGDRHRKAVR